MRQPTIIGKFFGALKAGDVRAAHSPVTHDAVPAGAHARLES